MKRLRFLAAGLCLGTVTALTPVLTTRADSAPPGFVEVEQLAVLSGQAEATCLTFSCLVFNGSIGSDCNEVELTPGVAVGVPPEVFPGEGLDGSFCQAFINAQLTVSGCVVTGFGQINYTEDDPTGPAFGQSFDFMVTGTVDEAVIAGTNTSPDGATDRTVGTLSLGSNCTTDGIARYTVSTTAYEVVA